jgi:hypothetical protein
MINKLVKVDRVRSAEEALAVEGLGAGLVGVELSPDPRYDDDRVLTVEQAALVGKALRRARLVAAMQLTAEPVDIMRVVAATGAALVQTIHPTIPAPDVRAALREAGIGIVYSGVDITHDEDPAWVFSAFTDTPDLGAVLFQADVLSEYRDAWAFLRDRSPEYPAEFQIADLDALGREYPLVIGLDFTPDNLAEIIEALPAVRGIVFTLADRVRRDDTHRHAYPAAIATLQRLTG